MLKLMYMSCWGVVKDLFWYFVIAGNFQAGESGSVLKKLDKKEKQCYIKLMHDNLRPLVPEYKGDVEKNGESILSVPNSIVTDS